MIKNRESNTIGKGYIYVLTENLFRIVLLASILISLAVIITGILSYNSTKNALIAKTQSQDLIFIVKSMSEKIEGRIQRAMETSYIIAKDPYNHEWLMNAEMHMDQGEIILNRLKDIAVSYDYDSTFIASTQTHHYYFADSTHSNIHNTHLMILSKENPADIWFYDTLTSKKPISLNVDFNRGLNDTFLFVNALVGNTDAPLGIAGVGLSLREISSEFQQFKVGEKSNLWLIDENNIIKLSDDLDNRGKNVREFLPHEVINQMQNQILNNEDDYFVSEYKNIDGEMIDYAFYTLHSSDWILYYQLPRSESISLIASLRTSTTLTIILVLLFFVTVFYIITKKIANPYRQAILLNKELEKKVTERTQELKETNVKVMDSIDYAKRMQESILPSKKDLQRIFKEYFVIWRPRDVVGGDFYWLQEVEDTIVLAVGDCTGHGVPGALMTMTVNAILYNIIDTQNKDNPEIILKELHQRLKQALHKDSNTQATDDGLDIAICCIKNKSQLIYAGAKIDLYIKNPQELRIFKGSKKSVGYHVTNLDANLSNVVLPIKEGDVFILTSDGFLHQNGGPKNYPFGTKRFHQLIEKCDVSSMPSMKAIFEKTLEEYMKDESQRDDISLIAFKMQ
ncbi:SpoIIE family protein phosphatase [Clostridium formicaceticum]|uniref:Serine/threonine protein phosphatase n=1 Tax=Clostridium formicaceticum TaxID=1497 RepID=A0AAC9WGZ5_9CLOT|nr:SpoIIE family protein phosphatase [Clostridium formicaceticum]AOY77935.1 serine/threonine protein phosphatase [Clostridium formicaceticum]ARE88557.1 Stage II sporulation protein E (SpoIIE) [Clostridium formicaceticum]